MSTNPNNTSHLSKRTNDRLSFYGSLPSTNTTNTLPSSSNLASRKRLNNDSFLLMSPTRRSNTNFHEKPFFTSPFRSGIPSSQHHQIHDSIQPVSKRPKLDLPSSTNVHYATSTSSSHIGPPPPSSSSSSLLLSSSFMLSSPARTTTVPTTPRSRFQPPSMLPSMSSSMLLNAPSTTTATTSTAAAAAATSTMTTNSVNSGSSSSTQQQQKSQLNVLMKRTNLLQQYHHLTTPATIQNVKCIQSILLQMTYLNAMLNQYMNSEQVKCINELYEAHMILFHHTRTLLKQYVSYMDKKHELLMNSLVDSLYDNVQLFMTQYDTFMNQTYSHYTQLLEYSKHVVLYSGNSQHHDKESILSLVQSSEHMIQCMNRQMAQYEQMMIQVSNDMKELNRGVTECHTFISRSQYPLIQHVMHNLASEETSLSFHLKQQQQKQQQTDTAQHASNASVPLLYSAIFD